MPATIFKQLSADVQPVGDRRVRFVISTGSTDRDGDVLEPSGWQLDAYRRSPVILWAHDYSMMPIAKAVTITQTSKGLEATAEFPQPGIYEFADTTFAMLKAGYLSATSVGFRPIESEPIKGGGRRYLKQELLEFSVVPVPSNGEALMLRGVSHEQAAKWKKALTTWAAKTNFPEAQPASPVMHPLFETEQDFMNRCMSDSAMRQAYPNDDIRYGECSLRWARDTGWAGIPSTPPAKFANDLTLDIRDSDWHLEITDQKDLIDISPQQFAEMVMDTVFNVTDTAMKREIQKQLRWHMGRVI
jgi:uncharacterized protein